MMNNFSAKSESERQGSKSIIPLLKDGDHEEPSNNRPLSMLAIASKIWEKVQQVQQVSNDLQYNTEHLSKHQSGNRKHHSAKTLNIMMSDFLLDAMDNERLSALILLDLSKALDSISHPVVLQTLGLVAADKTTKWFKSYLSGSTQVVRIGTSTPIPLPITHGVA